MGMTNNMENAVLDASLGAGATLLGSTVEIALSTTTIADDGTGITEPSVGAYARVSVSNDGTNWGAASGGIKTNAVDIIFPEATAGWGTLTHWALYDSGVMKFHGTIDDGAGTPDPITVVTEDRVRFTASQLRITLD
jgi:hypothetical protein